MDEAIHSDDPFVFVSLLNAIANERSRVGLSIDSCLQILSHVLEIGLLSLPYTPSSKFVSQCSALPFSKPLPVATSSEQARGFPSSSVADLSSVVGSAVAAVLTFVKRLGPTLVDIKRTSPAIESNVREIAREDRAEKASKCLELLNDIGEVLRADLRNSKLLRREKEELVTEIIALIQC